MKRQDTDEDSLSVPLFEELYICTFHEVCWHISMLMDSFRDAKELLIRVYLNAYISINQIPERSSWSEWVCGIADQLAESKFGVDQSVIEAAGEEDAVSRLGTNLSVDETSVYLDIEERISLLNEDDETSEKQAKVLSSMQGIFSALLLMAAVTVLAFGIGKAREQLDVLREPLVKPLDDKDGNPVPIEVQEITITISGKVVYLSDEGQVKYSLPLETGEEEYTSNPEIQKKEGWTYYLPLPEREDSSLSEVAPFLHHTLYRMNTQGEEIEIVATEVEDYTFWDDNIYVSQFGRIRRINDDEVFEKIVPGIYPEVNNNEIYLYDMIGRPLGTDNDGNIRYGDRVVTMTSNRIDEVEPAVQKRNDTSYYFKRVDGGISKEIYRSINGREEVYIQQNERIDSFCVAGDWLYFSAYIRKGGSGAHYSELYRKKLTDDSKPEKVHDEYTGRILQMYFSEEKNQIYANYIPKNWKSNYGVIAVISMSGHMSYLDDKEQRSVEETTGNDMLEFVMVYDNQVYCFWKDCIWSPGESPVAIWRKVLVIPDSSRIQMD